MEFVRSSRLRTVLHALLAAVLGAVLVSGLATPAMAAPAPVDLNSSSCPANMVSGEDDGCVVELQTLLNTHGFGLGVDGDFGANTVAAVRTFQSETGIGVDGQVGPQTKAALYVSSGSVPDPITLTSSLCPANMVSGEDDGCVTELQDLLNQQGAHLSIDGSFGANTLAAVKAFQSANGLGVDGQVGPETKAALYSNVSTAPGAPAPLDLQSSSCPANMVEGEHDGCVTTLQSFLNSWGEHLAVDGDFGAHTFAAVESFQAARGIGVDGQVGAQTKSAIYSDGVYYCPPIGCPGQGQPIQPYVVAAAKAMVAQNPPMPYAYAGGHGTTPGPSLGRCVPPDAHETWKAEMAEAPDLRSLTYCRMRSTSSGKQLSQPWSSRIQVTG